MGIMQFESWQAMGFGVPVLRRGKEERGSLSLAWELFLESLPKQARSQDWPLLFKHHSF